MTANNFYRSDFIYMAPPFLAYYAISTQNDTLLDVAVQQVQDYRAVLKSSSGAWSHISASSHPDTGFWSTGNGWAAMGITRVLAAILVAPSRTTNQQTQTVTLRGWVKEIIDAAMKTPVRTDRNAFFERSLTTNSAIRRVFSITI
jgi:rhamnogalacturonyl hydrolase YesR